METNKNEASILLTFRKDLRNGMAKYYSYALGQSVRRAFVQKSNNGELIGRAPFGYINAVMTEADYKRATIMIDAEKGHLVKRMFELASSSLGDPFEALKAEMPEMRADNPQGAQLSRSQIIRILTNPFYCGIVTSQNYGNYEHRYAHLITRELFDKCQEVLCAVCPLLPCISVSSILTKVNEADQNEK